MLSSQEEVNTVTVSRHPVTQVRDRLGASLDSYLIVNQITGRLYEKSGKPTFANQGRTDESTHTFIYNATQYTYSVVGNPFTGYASYQADLQIGDQVLFQKTPYLSQLFRVDNVIDPSGLGDHYEARLTLCLPGGES